MSVKIISVVGARPNFMKIAPFIRAINEHNSATDRVFIEHILVHTGQHYDVRMNKAFFEALNIPDANINLEIGSGTHAEQVGNTMIAFERVVKEYKPDWVVVVGDVNATCACSITAKKEHICLAHIESGLRSFDMEMPEEINRMVTDRLSDLLFTPDRLSGENLRHEGVPDDRILFVGNIMIDTLEANREKAAELNLQHLFGENRLIQNHKTVPRPPFAVVTLHRPSNVDQPHILGAIVDFLKDEVVREMPVVWPMHPRTRKNLEAFGVWDRLANGDGVFLLHPVGYHEMLRLNMAAGIVMTDSGGLQEECCVLGTPCLTLRWNTERPITLQEHGGAGVLVGNDVERLRQAFRQNLERERRPQRPELWDGKTAERILKEMLSFAPKTDFANSRLNHANHSM